MGSNESSGSRFGSVSTPNHQQKSRTEKSSKLSNFKLPMIKCRCGKEILLVSDVQVMGEAIEAHVKEHKKNVQCRKNAEAEAERTRDDLIAKVLRKASGL